MFYNAAVPKRAVLDQLRANVIASSAEFSDYSIPVPEGLEYLPYQKAGIEFGIKNAGVLIADEPGLGKTIQAIGIINKDRSMKKILVVCPSTLKINWKRELQRWLVDYYSISIATDTISFLADIVIVNYEQLEKYESSVHQIAWDMVIADECHLMRNKNTLRAQHVIGSEDGSIKPVQARRKVFLTGTPILNRAKEIWALISYLNPKVWNSYENFAEQFCKKAKNESGEDDDGSSNLEVLQELLRATVMIRRLKSRVLKQLPKKFRDIVKLEVSSQELQDLVEKENRLADAMQKELEAAQQIVQITQSLQQWSDYEIALQNFHETRKYALAEISRVRHKTAVLKCPLVINYVQETLQHADKIVVFAHHQDVVAKIAAAFGSEAVTISGQQTPAARQLAVDAFQRDPKIRVCVASILAAGVGLTLTAAHHVIFAELDWVPANVTQAEDRCHRIGQLFPVIVKHLILDGSIDIKVVKKIMIKQQIYDQALN